MVLDYVIFPNITLPEIIISTDSNDFVSERDRARTVHDAEYNDRKIDFQNLLKTSYFGIAHLKVSFFRFW